MARETRLVFAPLFLERAVSPRTYRLWRRSLGWRSASSLSGTFDDLKRRLYANCLAVYFGPYDEDYGYVTLGDAVGQASDHVPGFRRSVRVRPPR